MSISIAEGALEAAVYLNAFLDVGCLCGTTLFCVADSEYGGLNGHVGMVRCYYAAKSPKARSALVHGAELY